MESSYTLYPFQEETIEYGKRNSYSILALQQGLGKSLASLCIAQETNSRTLIVCPSYLKLNWVSEINKFFPGSVVTVFNTKEDLYKPWDSDFAIVGYSFLHEKEVVEHGKSIDRLFEWADLVIADESHYLKTYAAKRTEAFHRLIYENSIKRLLLLTGTPIENRVYEFYSLIALANYNPKIAESAFLKKFPTWVDFANHFSYLREFEVYINGRRKIKQQWEGYRNVEELKGWLKDCYIRFRTDDVLDMPPYQTIDVSADYADTPELLEEFERYSSTNEESIAGLEAKAKAALATAQFTTDYSKNILEQCGKVIIYTDHIAACEYIAKKFDVPAITGSTLPFYRAKFVEEFQNGTRDVIVATIGSLSTGVTLTKSYNMVFNDPPYTPSKLEQAMYRIRRIGQTEKCVFHLIHGTIQSKKIYAMLERKMETINAVV